MWITVVSHVWFQLSATKKRKKGDKEGREGGGDIIWMLLKKKEKTEAFKGREPEERRDKRTGKGHSCPSLM